MSVAHAGIFEFLSGGSASPPPSPPTATAVAPVAAAAPQPALPDCAQDWPPRHAGKSESSPGHSPDGVPGKKQKPEAAGGKKGKKPAAGDEAGKPQASATAPGHAPCQPLKTVKASGRDLLNELVAMKQGFAIGQPTSLFSQVELKALSGNVGAAAPANAANPLGNLVNGLFSGGSDALLDILIAQMSYAAIDGVLGQLLDDKSILEKIEVELPNPSRFEPGIRKKVLTMSAYLVAVKAAGSVIGSGQTSLEKAKDSYKDVIAMREQQARLLGEGAFVRDGMVATLKEEKARNTVLIGEEDRNYVNSFAGKPVDELFKDPRAVNIVFNYLRARDPNRFKDYELKVAEVKSHYDSYVRATLGAGSMMGFTAMFARQAKKFIEQYQIAGAAELMPLVQQSATEALAMAPKVVSVFQNSDGQLDGTFTLERNGEVLKAGVSAEKVLATLGEDGRKQFRSELIASADKKSLLYRLYTRAPLAAIEITDEATSKDARNEFAKSVLALDVTPFLFRNAFVNLPAGEKKKLGQKVYMEPAGEDDEAERAYGKLQKEIADKALSLRNTDLRMLMYASSVSGAHSSSLRVGDYVIRLENPGVSGIADYEAFAKQTQSTAVLRDYSQEKTGGKKKSL